MIVFEQPKVHKSISNKEPYVHIFKAWNNSNSIVRQVALTKGCSCTNLVAPIQIGPQEHFEVKMVVDKTGQTGLYSVSAIIEYDDESKIKLNLNGKLLD